VKAAIVVASDPELSAMIFDRRKVEERLAQGVETQRCAHRRKEIFTDRLGICRRIKELMLTN
jgi:hypothetical protein